MKPIVEKEESGFYKFNVMLATKRGLEVAKISGAFGLTAAWFLAGIAALVRWGDYHNPEAGWIIIWVVVSAIIGGAFMALDVTGEGK